jgi:hypothetical protein
VERYESKHDKVCREPDLPASDAHHLPVTSHFIDASLQAKALKLRLHEAEAAHDEWKAEALIRDHLCQEARPIGKRAHRSKAPLEECEPVVYKGHLEGPVETDQSRRPLCVP